MVELHELLEIESSTIEKRAAKFCINDNVDLLIEILQRLDDDRSLGVAACVCRLWCALTRNDALWEHLCFRHLSPPADDGVRAVVVALGGYRRLYMVCVKPVLMSRLRKGGGGGAELEGRVWTRHELELSLSLFCVDYYERFLLGDGGGRLGGESASPPSSLMFLWEAVNV
ncbi:hypothetical protein BUALT_Bualt18G0002200 [Buddleja alternifolia]|uniref:F-box domain-containing protein n=1 Tax=Buddleja alternifolia TaxID=168488 RepID=A0AAV6WBZ7_9LAMI|nr:hypothetical protein BUALT_Bualt18G0002200 [Buddleja alternifolia]